MRNCLAGNICAVFIMSFMLFSCDRTGSVIPESEPAVKKNQIRRQHNIDFAKVDALDEKIVAAFLERLSAAYSAGEIEFLKKHIAQNAVIEVEQEGRLVAVNKDQYLKLLDKVWKRLSDYQFSYSSPNLIIQEKKAGVHLLVSESGKAMGRVIKSEAETDLGIGLENGCVIIVSIKGRSKMTME